MTIEEIPTPAKKEEVWTLPTKCPKCGSMAIIPLPATKSVVCRDCRQETVCE